MSNKIKLIKQFPLTIFVLIFGAVFASVAYLVTPLLAAPFIPGETLDPNCPPGSPTCYIVEPWTSSTSSPDIIFGQLGKIGVGSSTPTDKLTVVGNTHVSDILTVASTTGTSTFSGNLSIGNSLCINGDCRTVWPSTAGGSSLWSTTTGSIIYYNDTVLIATTTDDDSGAKLQVNGVANIPSLVMHNPSNGDIIQTRFKQFVDGTSAMSYNVNDSGVVDNGDEQSWVMAMGGGTGAYMLQMSETTNVHGSWDIPNLRMPFIVHPSGNTRLENAYGAYSGIGNALSSDNGATLQVKREGDLNPVATFEGGNVLVNNSVNNLTGAKLQVNGSLSLSGGLFDSTMSTGTAGMVLQTTGTSTRWATMSGGGSSQWLNSVSPTGAIYYNGGNIGIGTSTPSAKLTLNGGSILHTVGGSPSLKGEINMQYTHGGKISVSGKYAYVPGYVYDGNVSNVTFSGFKIFDVSNPTSPSLVGTYNSAIPNNTYNLYVSGKYVYVTVADSGLQIVDISNPYLPVLVGTYGMSGMGGNVIVSGKYAYVTNPTGLSIIDISNPANPVLKGVNNDPRLQYSSVGFIAGKYAYVTYADPSLLIVDISDPTSPTIVGTQGISGESDSVYVSGKYAYVTAGNEGLQIVDISNPTSPVLVGTYTDVTNYILNVEVAGNYAYISSNFGLRIIDISNPTSPLLVNSFDQLDHINSFDVSGKYIYGVVNTFDDNVKLQILDLDGIETPTLYAGSIQTNSISITENANISDILKVGTSLTVGQGGILSNGDLSAAGTVRLTSLGVGTVESLAGGILTVSSDERMKDVRGYFSRGLNDLKNIKPISYTWKLETGYGTSTVYTGFSAQNVLEFIPEAVSTSSKGFLTFSDRPVLATVVNAVKEIGSFISKIENGVVYLKNIIVESLTVGSAEKPTGITVYDDYGKPACMSVRDANSGSVRVTPGACGTINLSTNQQSASITNSTPIVPAAGITSETPTSTIIQEVATSTVTTIESFPSQVLTTTTVVNQEVTTTTPVIDPIVPNATTSETVSTQATTTTPEVSTSTTSEPEVIGTSSAASILIPIEAVKNFLLNLFGFR